MKISSVIAEPTKITGQCEFCLRVANDHTKQRCYWCPKDPPKGYCPACQKRKVGSPSEPICRECNAVESVRGLFSCQSPKRGKGAIKKRVRQYDCACSYCFRTPNDPSVQRCPWCPEDPPKGVCLCCLKNKSETFYGLCRECYANEDNRDKYPRRPYYHEPDWYESEDVQARKPDQSTKAKPGSEEKIQIMRERVMRGESPHHEDDVCEHIDLNRAIAEWGKVWQGIRYIYKQGNKWIFRPWVNGKRMDELTKRFDTEEQAIFASRKFEEQLRKAKQEEFEDDESEAVYC